MRNNGDAEFWSIPFRRCKYSAGHAYFTICILLFVRDTAPTALALLHHVRDPSLQWTRRVCIWNIRTYRAQNTNVHKSLRKVSSALQQCNECVSKLTKDTHIITGTSRAQHKFRHILQPPCISNVDSHTHKHIELYGGHVGQQLTIRIPQQQNQSHFCYTNIGAACK